MSEILMALEPEPSWIGEITHWVVGNNHIYQHNADEFMQTEKARLPSPQIGYLWTVDGTLDLETDQLPILYALQQIAPVFLWTWIPLRFYPNITDPLPTLPGISRLQNARDKIAHVVRVPDKPAWYWAAVRITSAEARAALQAFHLPSSFLVTDRANKWPVVIERLAQELPLERQIANDKMLLAPFLLDTIARLVAEDELLLRYTGIASDRHVVIIYGRPARVREFMYILSQVTPTEAVDPGKMWEQRSL